MPMTSQLPPEFADLEPFAGWALPTERERYAHRLSSTMQELQAFYEAALPRLDDAAVYSFAESKKFDEVTVAIALLNEMPIEMMARLMEGPRADLLLIPCRSARLNWPTVESILRNRPVMPSVNQQTLEIAERDYRKLSMETAQRTVRFWQLHNRIEK